MRKILCVLLILVFSFTYCFAEVTPGLTTGTSQEATKTTEATKTETSTTDTAATTEKTETSTTTTTGDSTFKDSKDISIVYTGDIHSDVTKNISLAGVKAYANSIKDAGCYTEMVDLGDTLSGTVYASISNGEYAVEAMNLAGYGIAVPGAGDFAFGAYSFNNILSKEADYTYVSANYMDTATGKTVLKPYVIKTYGKVKVAYIGITDPDTASLVNGGFKDASGNDVYSFLNDANGTALYQEVQKAIDLAKADGANYIVCLGRLNETATSALSATAVIKNTTGINAFINGKTHNATQCVQVNDKASNPVVLTNPGAELKKVGVLTISPSKNEISVQLVSSINIRDVATRDGIDKLKASYDAEMKTVFATTSSKLITSDEKGVRVIESQETNFGDLVADAYKNATGADIAFAGASEFATNVALGSISYGDILNAIPKGDGLSVVTVSGLEIMDALEMSSRLYPSRNANFLQVAGLTYDINETVPVSVTADANGNFVSVDGDYRVTNIYINGKKIDLLGTYTVAATNSFLNGDTGYTMFKSMPFAKLNVASDNLAVISYIAKNLAGAVGAAYNQPQRRIDSIKLARQSEIEAEVQARIDSMTSNYATQIKELKEQIAIQEKAIAIKSLTVKADSKYYKASGKRKIKVSWTTSEDVEGVKYQIYKSTKKTSGFKKLSSTSNKYYINASSLTKGKTYYYKVRAYIYVGGKYYYSNWSEVISRKVTS